MVESRRIADQLQRAFDGEAWHGPSLREVLQGVTAPMAAAHLIPGIHSIWQITAHITVWETVIARRLRGEHAAEPLPNNFPAPPPHASEEDWANLTTMVHEAHALLVGQIAALTDDELSRPVEGHPYPVWFMAHGAVGHALYHVGQIALLAKTAGVLKSDTIPAPATS